MNNPTMLQDFCFCTAAFGKVYRSLAKLLARDLLNLAPNIRFIVFTDKPNDFVDYPNIELSGIIKEGLSLIMKGASLFNMHFLRQNL